MIENLAIAKIRRDGGTQPRAVLDEATIAEYAEAMRRGDEFPPVDVFYDGTDYWLADGFHRLAAAESLDGLNVLNPANVHQGTRRDAILYSTGVNENHGLRRSNADKRRAVTRLLTDPEWSRWSNREIARQAKVSLDLVNRMRDESVSERIVQIGAEQRTVTRGDSTYTMHTANIGPRWAAIPALAAAIRTWLSAWDDTVVRRAVVKQMLEGTAAGPAHLDRLLRSGQLPTPFRRDDAQAALRGILAEYDRPASPVGSAVEPDGPGAPTEAQVLTTAEGLKGMVFAWLSRYTAGSSVREVLAQQAQLTGSLLDLEGFSARRGRNFDWEKLVGAAGSQVDHAALRQAVELVRTELLARLVERPEDRLPAADAGRPAELAEVVTAWLDQLTEDNELPDDKDARRIMLNGILTNHRNDDGYKRHWKALRQFEKWPSDAGDDEKLEAVRSVLTELTGRPAPQPVTIERRPPSLAGVKPVQARQRPAPDTVQEIARRGSLLTKLTTKLHEHLDALIVYAAKREEPDEDLATLIEGIQNMLDWLERA
jgi:hypothetical protein